MTNSAIIVNRVSSARQEDGFSLEAQHDLNERYCTQKGFDLSRIFTFAESAGDQKQRSEFEKVLKFITEKRIQHLVLEKTDRLMRNMTDYVKMQEYIRNGLTLHLVKENLVLHKESSSTETFLFDINVVIAKRFLQNLSEETKKGLNRKLKAGGYPARAPLGYSMIEKKLVPNDDAKLVREIFELYVKPGHSTITLAKYLTERGTLPPRGKVWHPMSLHKILTQPAYIGKIRWKGNEYAGIHTPLISLAQWDAVQAKRSEMAYAKTTQSFALSQILKLHNGRTMSGERHKSHNYYCAWITVRGTRTYVREDRLFAMLDEKMTALRWTHHFCETILDVSAEILQQMTDSVEPQIRSVEKRLAEARGRRSRLLEIYLSKEVDRDLFEEKNAEIDTTIRLNELELSSLKVSESEVLDQIRVIGDTFINLPQIYANAEISDKGKILRQIVKQIVFNEDETVSLTYLAPFSNFITPEIMHLNNGQIDRFQILTLMRPIVDALRTYRAA